MAVVSISCKQYANNASIDASSQIREKIVYNGKRKRNKSLYLHECTKHLRKKFSAVRAKYPFG